MAGSDLDFHFFSRDIAMFGELSNLFSEISVLGGTSSILRTFLGGTSQKRHPVCIYGSNGLWSGVTSISDSIFLGSSQSVVRSNKTHKTTTNRPHGSNQNHFPTRAYSV